MARTWIVGLVFLTVPVMAHEAPSGWAYDRGCCGDQDCHPYPDDQVTLIPGGYRMADGEVVMEGDKRLHWSPDGRYHRCDYHALASQEITEGHKARCFYRPMNSSSLSGRGSLSQAVDRETFPLRFVS